MRVNNNQLIAVIVGLLFCIVFILGCTLTVGSIMIEKINTQRITIDSLQKENAEIKIENKGLWGLIKIKDNQYIGHYTHTEVVSKFRIVKRRK